MKRGISPIVAVVLLIAIAVVSAVGLYFWAGGLVTKQTTPQTPIAISAYPVDNTASELNLLIANLGSAELPAGTTFYTASGANTTLQSALPAGQQTLLTFWGGSDGSTTTRFTDGSELVYSNTTGSAIVETEADDPVTTAEVDVTGDAGASDLPSSLIQDGNGMYWMGYYSGDLGLFEAYVVGAASPEEFNKANAVNISGSPGSDDHSIRVMQDREGKYFAVFQSNRGGTNGIYSASSENGAIWGNVNPVHVVAGENHVEPWVMQASDGSYWVAWRHNTDGGDPDHLYLKNSTDRGATWNNAFVVRSGRVFNPTMALGSDGIYRLVVGNDTNTPLVVMAAADPNEWGEATDFGEWSSPGGDSLPYLFQDSGGRHLISFMGVSILSQLCSGTRKVYVAASRDGLKWGHPARISEGVGDRDELSPVMVQGGDGVYWIAYAQCNVGAAATDILVKSSTDPLIWN